MARRAGGDGSVWLTVIDVSDALEIPIARVYDLIEDGRLVGHQIGRATMVAAADLEVYVAS